MSSQILVTAQFLVTAQWQGSGSSRAMQLADGTESIRHDLPEKFTTIVPVPLGAGTDHGSKVRRLSSLIDVRDSLTQALASTTGTPIVIGGDCGVELAAITHASRGKRLAVVWFDAHADLNTPESSPSGAFHGMVLRTLLGDGEPLLTPSAPLSPQQIILAGTRALDEAESSYVQEEGIRLLPPDALTAASLVDAIRDSGADSVYIHVDLDVLDPAEIAAIGHPEPFGITAAGLIQLIRAAAGALPLVGAGITEFAPRTPDHAADDLPTILRIIGALTAKGSPNIEA